MGRSGIGISMLPRTAAIAAAALLTGCVPSTAPAPAPPASAPLAVSVPPSAPPGSLPNPPAGLAQTIEALARNFPGRVGIAVRDIQAGWTIAFNGDARFPQQSVSKTWVAIAALDAIDRGALRLDDEIVIRRDDLTLFHQPIRAFVGPDGYSTTFEALLTAAMTQSDNTANDALLRRIGGPEAVRRMLAAKEIAGIAFGPGERLLQSRIAGLEWRPEMSLGNRFYTARAALPIETRRAALDRYLANPMDGAAPSAIADALARLRKGELLSPRSTQLLLALMAASRTGPQRMRAGAAPGWAFAHKTGTGQELEGLATGYNDVGLLTSPDGRSYALAVMIASTRAGIPARQRLMSEVSRAVVSHERMAGR